MTSGRSLAILCVPAILLGTALQASAQTKPGGGHGSSEFILIAAIVLLVLLGLLLGEMMQRVGQPAIMGQLFAGIILGPTVFGALWPDAQHVIFPASPEQKAMLDGISQFGILMLLLLAGMETDLALVRRVRAAAAAVSLTGIVLPFAAGFLLGQFLPDALLPKPDQRLITSLFLGTALSISSVKIVAVVLREMNFMRRKIGQVILASAIIDDTIGWIIIAITFGLAAQGAIDWLSLTKSVGGTLLFLAASFTLGRSVVFKLIRWTNDYFVSEAAVVSVIIIIMGTMALITHGIGVHTVLGAFIAGMLIGESPILTRQIDERLRALTTGLFMPVFFGAAGLSADLTVLHDPRLALLTLGLILIASIGKATGAFAGGFFGGFSARESIALASGMNARGSTEVIVASIGLSLGLLSQTLFTMIVTMAVITTLAMPPMLRWSLARIPIEKEEQRRLDREDFEAKGFVSHLERVLVAVDHTANGLFAARLAGLLAGSRGMPVTVLRVGAEGAARKAEDNKHAVARTPKGEQSLGSDAVEDAAKRSRPAEESRAVRVEVLERSHDKPDDEAVAKEAEKGFGILFMGVEEIALSGGQFHPDVSRIASGFDEALAVVSAKGRHLSRPRNSRLNILVPISGNAASRRGAEVAIALGKAANAPITALSVAAASPESSDEQRKTSRRDANEVLGEITTLAEFYDIRINTTVRGDVATEEAILRELRRGDHDLIVLGVSRRPGEELSFGPTAAALLEHATCSILFVAT